MMEAFMRTQLLALLISVPLVASGAAGVVLHVCQSMGGVVVADCDCEKRVGHGAHADHDEGSKHAAHEAGAKLQAQPCCTVELSSTSELVATQKAPTPQIDDASLAVLPPTDSARIASRNVCDLGLLRERAPPNVHGPPIFIRNCSFLN